MIFFGFVLTRMSFQGKQRKNKKVIGFFLYFHHNIRFKLYFYADFINRYLFFQQYSFENVYIIIAAQGYFRNNIHMSFEFF